MNFQVQYDINQSAGFNVGYRYSRILDHNFWTSVANADVFTHPQPPKLRWPAVERRWKLYLHRALRFRRRPHRNQRVLCPGGVWIRPTPNWRIHFDAEAGYPDNFPTRIDPRHQQRYRGQVSYTPRAWLNLGANLNLLEARNHTADYEDENAAMSGIAKSLSDFYSSKYLQQYGGGGQALPSAIREVQRIYVAIIFPYMKVDWRTHPNNVGHYYTPGCFRCHDGQHVSAEGKVIPKDCDPCHSVIAQAETARPATASLPKMQFFHPVDIGDLKSATCSDCHTGTSM